MRGKKRNGLVCLAAFCSLLILFSGCATRVRVTLDPAGGSLPGRSELSFFSGITPKLPNPEREGYLFVGWNRDPSEISENTTLTALWEPLLLTVRFDLNGGETDTPALLTQTVEYGGSVLPPRVARENYRFVGWEGGYQAVTRSTVVRAMWALEPLGAGEIYEQCIGACVEIQTYDRSDISVSLGSGFLISPDGQVVTAAHVIKGARRIEVRLDDGRRFYAERVVAYDFERDIAILKIAGVELPYLEITYDPLENGQTVYTIGSPNGRTGEMSEGTLSRYSLLYNRSGYLATSIPLEGGSSGSPLLDARGRVIGANVAISNLFDESLAVKIEELELLERVDEDMATFDAKNAKHRLQMPEAEPNFTPERAQLVESAQFVRGTLFSAGDVDWYLSKKATNMMFFVSIDRKYEDLINIECHADGKISRIVSNKYYGLSGSTVIFSRTILSNEGAIAQLKIIAEKGLGVTVPYSLRVVVFDAAE